MSTDDDWEVFAAEEPYYSVCTHSAFRHSALTPDNRNIFFESGESQIHQCLEYLRMQFGAPERYEVALDYGCGVGRLLLPLAKRSELAIGVDVSPTMLKECRKNAELAGLENVDLRIADDQMASLQPFMGSINLLTSMLVFQHIPPERGTRIFGGLLDLLAPGGMGYIHFTIASHIATIINEAKVTGGFEYGFYQRISQTTLLRLAGKPHEHRLMQMNHYNMNELLCILYSRQIMRAVINTWNDAGYINVTLAFAKPRG